MNEDLPASAPAAGSGSLTPVSASATASTPPPAIGKPAVVSKKRDGFWFRRRSVPLPTWRLWLCALGTAAAVTLGVGSQLHSWLAVTDPVSGAKYMAIEGWAPDEVARRTQEIADDTHAVRIFCTGMPLEKGHYLAAWKTDADVTAITLAKLGVDPQRICPAAGGAVKVDRTRAMAMGLKAVLDGEGIPAADRKINLVSQGTHTRRSRDIFQEVLGPEWQVGIYSVPSSDYEPALWYRQSAGVKGVISESAAIFFRAVGLVH
ncbi:MAG: hypothetical protein EOP86_24055 [Verrucomicrobiaceae bacterium]|nr:MAG: hypothetical protein EOP86_24055 [Verrucomicrobiaceae bacterium]